MIAVFAVAGLIYYYQTDKKLEQDLLQNNISVISKIVISDSEKDQIAKSVDAFMNEYKLPQGVQNSYTLSIEKRLNESIEIIVNPGETGDTGNIIIHARKTDGVWRVDPSGGPWCTLEEFEQRNCF